MSMIQLHPYLFFMGEATEAMKFYHSVFGGDLKIQSYADAGQADNSSEKDLLMHGELTTDSFTFYASDGNAEHQVHMGDNMSMSLVGDDEETLTQWFQRLSEGGKVDLPLAKQFWGDTYGQLTDKFGVHWAINISAQK